jgi:hypothetical protein
MWYNSYTFNQEPITLSSNSSAFQSEGARVEWRLLPSGTLRRVVS